MEAGYVRGTIRDYKVDFKTLENIKHRLRSLLSGNVSHNKADSFYGRNVLQIYRCNSDIVWVVTLGFSLIKLLGEHLTPAAWRTTEINCSSDSFEDIEFFIHLEKFIRRSCSEPLFLSVSIVLIILRIDLPFEVFLFVFRKLVICLFNLFNCFFCGFHYNLIINMHY